MMRSFAGTLDAIEPIREWVAAIGHEAGLDGSAVYRLCLAVDEIVTNIIVHGYEEAGLSGPVEVDYAIDRGTLRIRLTDRAAAYDPQAHEVTAEMLEMPVDEREPGGLGLFLARDGVDDLRYSSTGVCNVHEFVVRLPQT